MTAVAAGLSWFIAGAGIVLGAATLLVSRRPALALHVLLDLLLAAGLLRLSADATWSAIAATVVVIVLRRLVTGSLFSAFPGPFSRPFSRPFAWPAVRLGGVPVRPPARR